MAKAEAAQKYLETMLQDPISNNIMMSGRLFATQISTRSYWDKHEPRTTRQFPDRVGVLNLNKDCWTAGQLYGSHPKLLMDYWTWPADR